MSFFTEDFIELVKTDSFAPISQSTFDDNALLSIADQELLLKLVSDIMSVRENYFLASKPVTIYASVNNYAIPSRAIGGTFKALFYVDSAGAERPLEQIDPDQRYNYAGATGEPSRFYVQGDEIILCPTPASSTTGSLLFQYYKKPSRLILTSSCAKITAINTVGSLTTLTVDTDLTADLSVGSKIDFLSTSAPFQLWAEDVVITAITSTTIEVAKADIVNAGGTVEPQVDDYICPKGFSNIPMLPEELHPVLVLMTSARILKSLGDLNKWNAAKAEVLESRKEALKLLKQRVESSPRKVAGKNGLTRVFGRS